jgi:hypothetical protein
MELDTVGYAVETDLSEAREKIVQGLASHGQSYFRGGIIMAVGATAVSKGIEEIIRQQDLTGLQAEFDRHI